MKKSYQRIKGISVIEVATKLAQESNLNHSKFLFKYVSCEVSCKRIIRCVDGTEIKDIKMDVRKIKRCFKSYGIQIDSNLLNILFSANSTKGSKSCKVLRDSLVHELSKGTLEEIESRFTFLDNHMDKYLKIFKNSIWRYIWLMNILKQKWFYSTMERQENEYNWSGKCKNSIT